MSRNKYSICCEQGYWLAWWASRPLRCRGIPAIITPLLLAGCAGATHVVPAGPDTYLIASHGVMGWSSGAAQKAAAMEQADAHCKRLGRIFEPVRTNETPGGFGQIASGEVEFRCIAK